jgi:tRNA A58 N-methylase Trm61
MTLTKTRERVLPALRYLNVVFKHVNLGDITIAHHWTGEKMLIHSFKHRSYWVHGKEREHESMLCFSRLIQKGDCVFDVGAHIGYTALYFGDLVGSEGTVYAFEPGPNNLPYTRHNLAQANTRTCNWSQLPLDRNVATRP